MYVPGIKQDTAELTVSETHCVQTSALAATVTAGEDITRFLSLAPPPYSEVFFFGTVNHTSVFITFLVPPQPALPTTKYAGVFGLKQLNDFSYS